MAGAGPLDEVGQFVICKPKAAAQRLGQRQLREAQVLAHEQGSGGTQRRRGTGGLRPQAGIENDPSGFREGGQQGESVGV